MFDTIATWLSTARYNQLTPQGQWRIWLLLAGRGFGKTRTCAEDLKSYAWRNEGSRIGVFAASFADGRDICFEGESGLVSIIPPSCIEVWNRSIGELKLINGSIMRLFSAEEPDRVRGHQFHRAWADELASYKGKITKKDAAAEGVPGTPKPMLEQIQLATRLKPDPRILISTTPRPLKLLKELIARSTTVLTGGSTLENRDNLAPEFLQTVLDLYEGTRLGRQELFAEILDEVEGALWNRKMIDDTRLDPKKDKLPPFKRIIVAVDPAVTANRRSNETGIIVIGLTFNNRAIVLQDASGKFSPDGWADRVISAYQNWGAHRIVAESNQGGDMVETIMRSREGGRNLPVKLVSATKGKIVRAEPVAALYEKQRVAHWGVFAKLEDEMCEYTGDGGAEESPDHLDALVWGVTELMLGGRNIPFAAAGAIASPSHWVAGDSGSDNSNSIQTEEFVTASGW